MIKVSDKGKDDPFYCLNKNCSQISYNLKQIQFLGSLNVKVYDARFLHVLLLSIVMHVYIYLNDYHSPFVNFPKFPTYYSN